MEAQPRCGPFVQTKRPALFRLHNLAAAYGQRPSAVVGLEDEWAAYQFDMACLTLGRRVESALAKNAAAKKNARKPEAHIIAEILGAPGEPKQYGSLTSKVTKAKTIRPGDPDWAIFMGNEAGSKK